MPRIFDHLATDQRENISVLQAALGRRRVLPDFRDHDASFAGYAEPSRDFRIERRSLHAQVAAMDRAVFAQLIHDIFDQVAGNGQADALRTAGAALDRGVDPNNVAGEVDERATAIARAAGRVGLQELFLHVHVNIPPLTAYNLRLSVHSRDHTSRRRT